MQPVLKNAYPFLQPISITPHVAVADVVASDYRAASVFSSYGISYCCGARLPISSSCLANQVDMDALIKDLLIATRDVRLSSALPVATWKTDFLADYIIHVHHHYLDKTLPVVFDQLNEFARGHQKKYPRYRELVAVVNKLHQDIIPHIRREEEAIFPYLKQVANAYEDKDDAFAGLLVKTLRKPVAQAMDEGNSIIAGTLFTIRALTDNYTIPEKGCAAQRVVLSKLKEMDNDLAQHFYLENEILFPRVISMEQEMLGR